MNLLAIQRRMARAVMTPLTRDEQMRPTAPGGGSMRAEAAKFIKRAAYRKGWEYSSDKV